MIEVTPAVVYSTYIAIKLHFDSDSQYDAFKFKFKVPSSQKISVFTRNLDRFIFEKISRKYPNMNNLIGFFLSNYLDNRTLIRDMTDDAYMIWIAKIQRMQYQFNTDMQFMYEFAKDNLFTFDDCLKYTRNNVPALTLLRKNKINAESVIILNELTTFFLHINKNIRSNDPLNQLSDQIYMLRQYAPFIIHRINKAAAENTVINWFTSIHQ